MSSTKGDVNKDEFYQTPQWLVQEFFESFATYVDPDWWFTGEVLDPSAGGVELDVEMPYPTVIKRMYDCVPVHTMDIREDSPATIQADYLATRIGFSPSMIVTNPPFSLSVEFVEKALTEVKHGGYVIMLQRLNWLGSKKRKPFWDFAPLHSVFVHHKRAGFDPEKPNRKDSIEYAHFVFKRGYEGHSRLHLI